MWWANDIHDDFVGLRRVFVVWAVTGPFDDVYGSDAGDRMKPVLGLFNGLPGILLTPDQIHRIAQLLH